MYNRYTRPVMAAIFKAKLNDGHINCKIVSGEKDFLARYNERNFLVSDLEMGSIKSSYFTSAKKFSPRRRNETLY